MRHQTRTFIVNFLKDHGPFKTVLDVGSLQVDSAELIRDLFDNYTGSDMRPGPNVDVVVNGHELSQKFDSQFDLVTCFDTFEHDDAFWLTLQEMKKVLKSGGYLLLGAPSRNCPLHGHPSDYWRFMKPSFDIFFDDMDDIYVEEQMDEPSHSAADEIYGYGKKK